MSYERSIDEVSVEFHSLMVINATMIINRTKTNKKQLRFD